MKHDHDHDPEIDTNGSELGSDLDLDGVDELRRQVDALSDDELDSQAGGDPDDPSAGPSWRRRAQQPPKPFVIPHKIDFSAKKLGDGVTADQSIDDQPNNRCSTLIHFKQSQVQVFQYTDGHCVVEMSISPVNDPQKQRPEAPYLDAFEKFAHTLCMGIRPSSDTLNISLIEPEKVAEKDILKEVITKLLATGATPDDRKKPENQRFKKVVYKGNTYYLENGELKQEPKFVHAAASLMPPVPQGPPKAEDLLLDPTVNVPRA